MKFRILSDLHLDFRNFVAPATPADVVLLAGDIDSSFDGFFWAQRNFGNTKTPVIYVPGNHEFYGHDYDAWLAEAKRVSAETGVLLGHKLSMQFIRPNGARVRVLATTLWTDFSLFGRSTTAQNGQRVEQSLYDYKAIQKAGRLLRWSDTKAMFEDEFGWLAQNAQVAKAAGEQVVVVTHHAPSLKSSLPRYMNDPVTAGFASNLDEFASANVDLYVPGHMHNNSDYRLGNCRVVSNPRGYPLYTYGRHVPPVDENPPFNPSLVVEL